MPAHAVHKVLPGYYHLIVWPIRHITRKLDLNPSVIITVIHFQSKHYQ